MPDLMSPRNFYNVAYYNGLWVAVGQSGEIQTSPDLSSWTHRTPDSETPDFRGVAGAAGMWVVVGDGASIQTSPDGMTWTRQSAATGFSNRFRGVDYGAGRWVAVGDDAEIQTSPDGVNWTRRSAAGGFFDEFWGVTYSEELSQWLAYGHHGELQVSSDGISWERRHFAGGFSGIAYDIAEGRGPATGSLTVNSGAAVGFSATCTDPDSTTPYTHAWDFDAGASNSTLKDPGAVVFSVPGTYHVSYTCTDGASLADATPAGVMVTVNAAPDCVIDTPSSATAIAVGAQVNFTASCTDPGNMTPLACKWDFDGGLNSVYIEDPGNRTFNSAGIYDVTLTCMDALGHVDPSIEAVTITVGDPPESTIDTPASDVTINEGEQVSFTATCTDPGGDTPFAHAWDFDGGATNSAAEDPGATTFDAAGIYNVSYTCTDDTGFADPSPAQVMVEVLVPGLPAGVWVVDDDAAPGGDGTSWATAFETLQDAVDAASAGDQVWVAEGTYKAASADAVVMTMKDEVSVYGGFSGLSGGLETTLGERPFPLLDSILDGDFTGDGVTSDDSNHIVAGASDLTLDGLQLKNGVGYYAPIGPDTRGAGIYLKDVSNIMISNCVVSGNVSGTEGAGIYADGVISLTLQNSIIEYNEGENGAGLYAVNSIVVVEGTTFDSNIAARNGGGLLAEDDTAISISDSVFFGNETTWTLSTHGNGGGAAIYGDGVVLSAVLFLGNTTTNFGGALYTTGLDITISDTDFISNSAEIGGAYYSDPGLGIVLTNALFYDNDSSNYAPSIYHWGLGASSTPSMHVTNASFAFNTAVTLAGSAYKDGGGQLVLQNTVHWGNTAAASTNFHSMSGSILIQHSCFVSGTSGGPSALLYGSNSLLNAATGNPFSPMDLDMDGIDEYYLDPASACVDAGSNVIADDATFGFPAFGLDWRDLTTRTDGMSESDIDGMGTETIDAGRHYAP